MAINENLLKIYENRNAFIVNESYSYKDICSISKIKYYNGGISRQKQVELFKAIFNIEEYKIKRKTMYKILSINNLTEEKINDLVEDGRGLNPSSWEKGNVYSDKLTDGLLASLYLMSLEDRQDNLSGMCNIDDTYFRIETDKYNLSCIMGIRNYDNFKNAKQNKVSFCRNLDIHLETFEFLYPQANNSIYKATNTVLSSLVKTGHVSVRNTMILKVPRFLNEQGYILSDEEIALNNEKMDLIECYAEDYYDADIIDKIKALRGQVANDMGYKSLSKVYSSTNLNVVKKFHEELQKVVAKKLNVYAFFQKTILIINKESILDYFYKMDYTAHQIVAMGTEVYLNHIKDKTSKNANIINSEEEITKKLDSIAKKNNTDNPIFYYNNIQKRKYFSKESNKFLNAILNPSHKEIVVDGSIENESYKVKRSLTIYNKNGSKTSSKTTYVDSKEDQEFIKQIMEMD